LVITKTPKKKLLTIFATPLSHTRKQVITAPSPGSSKDSPVNLTGDYEQTPFLLIMTNYAPNVENKDMNLNGLTI
jgi:hypothetical protein